MMAMHFHNRIHVSPVTMSHCCLLKRYQHVSVKKKIEIKLFLVQKQYERHLINNEQTTKGMVENFHNYAYKFNIIKKQTKCGCSFIMGIITCPTFIRLG